MIRLLVFACLVSGVVSRLTTPIFGRTCNNETEKGKPGIVWYYDEPRHTVYPFHYLGCGPTNGVSFSSARHQARLDRRDCPGYYQSSGNCTGSVVFIWPPPEEEPEMEKCKEGDYCLAFYEGTGGMCCNTEIKARYEENQKAKCPGNSTAVINEYYGNYKPILFGRKCTHNFCPEGTKCVDGQFEAYCCKKPAVVVF